MCAVIKLKKKSINRNISNRPTNPVMGDVRNERAALKPTYGRKGESGCGPDDTTGVIGHRD